MNLANNEQIKTLVIDYLRVKSREMNQKKKKSARNKRYYLKHKDKILQKNKIKNELYKRFVGNV